MDIQQAKQQIKYTMQAYFAKDEFGGYALPPQRQRPIFLLGAPGIGKTAIVEQIAQELEVGFVSYSMTHHTRQSALGLPFIAQKEYGGKTYDVSEYTMSEIIAAVYDAIEQTGHREGILFLDEINCVSETLTPAMLQFLQYKVFGRHKVPELSLIHIFQRRRKVDGRHVRAGDHPHLQHARRITQRRTCRFGGRERHEPLLRKQVLPFKAQQLRMPEAFLIGAQRHQRHGHPFSFRLL